VSSSSTPIDFNYRVVAIEVHNVLVDVTILETPKSLREKNVEFNEL
jgi:hypothetical protein